MATMGHQRCYAIFVPFMTLPLFCRLPYRPTPGALWCLVASLSFGWLLGAGMPVAMAAATDRDQPMNIEADALRHEDSQQTSVFTGNVVVTKGTIVIRGQQVLVRQDDAGNQFGTATGTPEQRAFFRQQRQGLNEFIEGQAQRIEYDSLADTVRFEGNAVLRRLRGSTLADETTGNVIVHNNQTETFTVDAQPAGRPNTVAPRGSDGRVRAMISPREEAATVPPPSDSVPLQPSTDLKNRP